MLTFVRTRHWYHSYTDFWRLVEASGFPYIFVDEISKHRQDPTRTFIFTPINGEVTSRLGEWRDRKCRIIWWNLERPEDETLASSLAAVRGAVDAIWVSDRAYAALHHELTYVPLAGHPNVGSRYMEKRYDVVHLAYVNARRKPIVDAIARRGITIAPEAFDRDAQDVVVSKSHLMLNMHQYDGMFIVAPIRFAMAASYGIPIVSEPYVDQLAAPLSLAQAAPADLPVVIEELLGDKERLRVHGNYLHERLCRRTDFGLEVMRAAGYA